MKKKKLILAGVISLIALLFTIQIAFAYERVTAGNYEIKYGWINEPPIVGQRNAFVINITDTTTPDAEIDVSNLMVMVSCGGGQEGTLELQPLGEDTPGQFIAPILPAVAGPYTLEFMGKIGDTDLDVSVEPEEVEGAQALAFLNAGTTQQNADSLGIFEWLAIAGLVSGLVSLVLSLMNLRKTAK